MTATVVAPRAATNPGPAPDEVGSGRGPGPGDGLVLVAWGAVIAFAVSWAAARSGSATSGWGRALGRLDGGLGVLLVVVGAVAQRGVTNRALEGVAPSSPLVAWRRVLRWVLVPWWVVVTVATFGYPTEAGMVVPSDGAAPTWIDVVRDWLLISPLGRPEATTPWPSAGAGRLGPTWVLTTIVAVGLLLPVWERALRRLTATRAAVDTAVAAGATMAVGGLALRLAVVAESDPTGWGVVGRVAPVAQLDLLGVGLVVGALAAGAAHGHGPLVGAASVVRSAAPRLGGVVALALVVGAAGEGAGSVLDPGGVVATLVGRVGIAVVAAAAVTAAMVVPRRAERATRGRAAAAALSPAALVGALAAVPLAAQLWATRAGGTPGTQRLGPLVLATVVGSVLAGAALSALVGRAFGPDGRRPLTPLSARLAVITAAALAWRLLTLVSINRRNPGGGDPFFYHHQANMLADRVGYSEPFRWVELGLAVPSAIHPPLLSTWLAGGSLLGARTFLAHKALTALLGVGVVVVAALVARRLAGDRAAVITAVVVAAYPNLWVIDGALWPEGAYTTMVALAVLAAYRWWEVPSLRRAVALGAAIALAALTRGEALFLFPLLVAPLVMRRRGVGLGAKLAAVAAAGVVGLTLLAPWTVRNLDAFDTVVSLSTNSDEVLYYANCPDSYGLADERPVTAPDAPEASTQFLGLWSFNCQQRERARAGQPVADADEAALYRRCLGERWSPELDGVIPGEPPGNEAERARYWRCLGLDYARSHRSRLPVVVAARLGRELDVFRPAHGVVVMEVEGRPRTAARVGQLAWWALAPVGVAGWVLLRRRGVMILPLVALAAMVVVTTIYAYGAVRFRTPLELGLLIGAGVAIDAAVAGVARRAGSRA